MKQTIDEKDEEILQALADGLTIKEIVGKKIFMSTPAINKRISELRAMFNVSNTTALIAKVIKERLIKV